MTRDYRRYTIRIEGSKWTDEAISLNKAVKIAKDAVHRGHAGVTIRDNKTEAIFDAYGDPKQD